MQTGALKQLSLRSGILCITKLIKGKAKLDLKLKPYYRILKTRGPVTYIIKIQMNGSTCKVHAEMLCLANILIIGRFPKMKLVKD